MLYLHCYADHCEKPVSKKRIFCINHWMAIRRPLQITMEDRTPVSMSYVLAAKAAREEIAAAVKNGERDRHES